MINDGHTLWSEENLHFRARRQVRHFTYLFEEIIQEVLTLFNHIRLFVLIYFGRKWWNNQSWISRVKHIIKVQKFAVPSKYINLSKTIPTHYVINSDHSIAPLILFVGYNIYKKLAIIYLDIVYGSELSTIANLILKDHVVFILKTQYIVLRFRGLL